MWMEGRSLSSDGGTRLVPYRSGHLTILGTAGGGDKALTRAADHMINRELQPLWIRDNFGAGFNVDLITVPGCGWKPTETRL